MTTALVIEILNLALALGKAQDNGAPPKDLTVAITLLQIVQKGAQAYSQHMGQALDPSLINVENPV